MILKRKDFLPLNTEEGQIGWATGIWYLLFLCILLCICLQTEEYRSASLYMEDALAASNLAAAVIDVEEYGVSHRVLIDNPQRAFSRYQRSIKGNLGLSDTWESTEKGWLQGTVFVDRFIVYNVYDDEVEIFDIAGDGYVTRTIGATGIVSAPNGKKVEATGIYSEISFDVEGIFGVVTRAHKGKLVDIVVNE